MKAADEDDYGEDEDEDDLFTLLTALRGILMTSIDTTGTQPGRPAWSDRLRLARRRRSGSAWAAVTAPVPGHGPGRRNQRLFA